MNTVVFVLWRYLIFANATCFGTVFLTEFNLTSKRFTGSRRPPDLATWGHRNHAGGGISNV